MRGQVAALQQLQGGPLQKLRASQAALLLFTPRTARPTLAGNDQSLKASGWSSSGQESRAVTKRSTAGAGSQCDRGSFKRGAQGVRTHVI